MARYTREQIESVNQTDMVDFLASEYGWKIVKVGNFYSTQEHDSIRIDSGRRLWTWNSKEIGGYGVFDWMEKIESQGFNPTMEKLLGNVYESANIIEYSTAHQATGNIGTYFDKNNIPQRHSGKYSNVFAYLTKTRSISAEVVSELMKSNRIYQDTRKNAVFANLDENGEVGFWCLRGTNTEKKYTRNMPGSNNPYYGFAVDAKTECDTLYVFESPIDLLSHCTIADLKYGKGSWHNLNRISLCGVNDTALKHYLSKHKNIRTIKFYLDNDETGCTATRKLMSKYYQQGYTTQSISYKNCSGKDIDEMLCNHIHKEKISVKTQPEDEQLTYETPEEEKPPIPTRMHNSYNYDTSYVRSY